MWSTKDGPARTDAKATGDSAGVQSPSTQSPSTQNTHIWASALFDEVVALGYDRSYVSFARQLRLAGLRPHCEACAGVGGGDTIEIAPRRPLPPP